MTAADARLERIAALRSEADDVKIVKLDKGMSIWFWMCPKHLAAREKQGWVLMETRPMVAKQECDDCKYADGRLR